LKLQPSPGFCQLPRFPANKHSFSGVTSKCRLLQRLGNACSCSSHGLWQRLLLEVAAVVFSVPRVKLPQQNFLMTICSYVISDNALQPLFLASCCSPRKVSLRIPGRWCTLKQLPTSIYPLPTLAIGSEDNSKYGCFPL